MDKEKGIERFVRPELTGFRGYSACKSTDVIARKLGIPIGRVVKVDANENNYGPSPKVARALKEFNGYHVYPDAAQTELRELLSKYTSMPAEQIVAGAGSDQLIDLLVKLFAQPGDEIINMVPSFAMYRFYADLYGATVVEIPRDANFHIDVKAIIKAVTPKSKLIFLANPNNPTGTMTLREDVLALLETGLPLVVDEAYYEFTGETALPLMAEYPNLMVLRTFSKWAGLAGLRIGYGVFPRRIADYLHGIRDPYNVNVAALTAVRASFQDMDYLMGNVKKIVAERERLYKRFEELKWLKPYPSKSNFILCDLLEGNAKDVQQTLENRGVLVRYYAEPRLKNCLRFSVGKPEEDDILLKALKEIGR
ncbi:MAG: histidinol-phosphate transaminase [Dehalococcoidia bacterium]|nr:MAG: histidinol-phosphate transaminase [Dehalococcoidia bacterium]